MGEIDRRHLDLASVHYKPLSTRADDKFLCLLGNMYMDLLQLIQPVSMGWCIFSTQRVHKGIHGFSEKSLTEDFDYVVRAGEYGAKMRVLMSGTVYISVRRLHKEGRLNYVKRAVTSEIYRIFNGKIIKEPMPFEFGKFQHDVEAMKLSKKDTFVWQSILDSLSITHKRHNSGKGDYEE